MSPSGVLPSQSRRLSKALSAHLTLGDTPNNFKIGDIVRAAPPGEEMKFEGVAVNVDDDNICIDFGDGEEPAVVPRNQVQRVANGTSLERGDVVQAKPPGTPVFCLGTISRVNLDGTFDIQYEGTDDVDTNVASEFIRKVTSGRSSAAKKWRGATSAITAARAFSKGFGWKPDTSGTGSLSTTVPIAEEKQ